MSIQGNAGTRTHMLSQKLEIIRRLGSAESSCVIVASYNIGSSTIYGIKEQSD
jgi:hypothetical protein